MLHDPQHVSLGVLDDAAVAEGIFEKGRQHRNGRTGSTMAFHQVADGRCQQQGHITAEDQDGAAVAGKDLCGLQDGVPCT